DEPGRRGPILSNDKPARSVGAGDASAQSAAAENLGASDIACGADADAVREGAAGVDRDSPEARFVIGRRRRPANGKKRGVCRRHVGGRLSLASAMVQFLVSSIRPDSASATPMTGKTTTYPTE